MGRRALVLGYDFYVTRQGVVVHQNPAATVARLLDNTLTGDCNIVGRVVSVSYRHVTGNIKSLVESGGWSVVVGLGLHPQAMKPHIELAAANIAYGRDVEGFEPRGARLYSDSAFGDVAVAAFEPTRLASCLEGMGVFDYVFSVSAGTYLCNALAYTIYSAARRLGFRAAFIHVPPAGSVALQLGGTSYGLDELARFVRAVIHCLCRG